jgi:hypothetical protein
MADKPKNELPKVPPFVIPGAPNPRAKEPVPVTAHVAGNSKTAPKEDNYYSQRGVVSLAISLISLVSLGISMLSGAWFAYGILKQDEPASNNATVQDANNPAVTPQAGTEGQDGSSQETTNNKSGQIFAGIVVIGLVFAVGWISGLMGIRVLGNLILPFFIRVYAILTLGGIIYLHFKIIEKLFRQEYAFVNFVKYVSLFGAGLMALVALHLMLEKHSLVPFALPILFTSLAHLYFIVFHYVFTTTVKYEYLWGDIAFFMITTIVSILMLAHFGLLNGMRRWVDHTFTPKDNQFVPPN